MKYRAKTSLLAGLLFLATGADDSLASSWSVTGISQNDTLNIRSLPSSKSDLLGEIPANGSDISVIRCIGVARIEQLEATDEQTIKKALSKSWCLVRYKSTTGWVSANYLKLGEKPVATDRRGLSSAPVWLAVFSSRDLVTATNKAISYQSNFPFVSVMASQSGFYAVALGAGAPDVLEQQRRILISRNSIPIDSYLTAGNSFIEVAWPKPRSIDELKKFAGNLLELW